MKGFLIYIVGSVVVNLENGKRQLSFVVHYLIILVFYDVMKGVLNYKQLF